MVDCGHSLATHSFLCQHDCCGVLARLQVIRADWFGWLMASLEIPHYRTILRSFEHSLNTQNNKQTQRTFSDPLSGLDLLVVKCEEDVDQQEVPLCTVFNVLQPVLLDGVLHRLLHEGPAPRVRVVLQQHHIHDVLGSISQTVIQHLVAERRQHPKPQAEQSEWDVHRSPTRVSLFLWVCLLPHFRTVCLLPLLHIKTEVCGNSSG